MDGDSKWIPIVGAGLVFVIVEIIVFVYNSGGNKIDLAEIGQSAFVNDIILPGIAVIVFGAIFLIKIANKKGIPLPFGN